MCQFSYIYWDSDHPILCKFFDNYWDYITKETLLLKIFFLYRLLCIFRMSAIASILHYFLNYCSIFNIKFYPVFSSTKSLSVGISFISSILKSFSNGSGSPHTSSGSFLFGFSFKQSSVMNGNCSKKSKSFSLSS